MTMTENLTTCPECGTDFATMGSDQEGALQTLEQECPECEHSVVAVIVNYPGGHFQVIAPPVEGDTCRGCGEDADYRSQRTGHPVKGICEEHLSPYEETAIKFGEEL